MGIQLKNNVSSTLAAAISASDVGMTVATGTGAQFPTLGASDYFYATLESSQGTQEIVKVTVRSGDNMTIVRAQDGSTANSFGIGARIELRINAAAINDLVDQVTASQVGVTPYSWIGATDAQSAFEEVVNDLAASSGTSLVGHIQSGSGAVARTVQAKLRETVSVKDFGAVGDGVTDDTAAIQAAIDAVFAAGGGDIFLPAGVYLVSAMLEMRNEVSLRGIGDESQILVNTDIVTLGNTPATTSTQLVGVVVTDLFLRNTITGVKTNYDIYFKNPVQCVLRRVRVRSGHNDTQYSNTNVGGVYFHKLSGSANPAWINTLEDCFIQNNSILFNGISDSSIRGGYVWGHTRAFTIQLVEGGNIDISDINGIIPSQFFGGIYLTGFFTNQIRISNCEFDCNPSLQTGICINAVNSSRIVSVTNVTFWTPQREGIRVEDPIGWSIVGNTFWNGNRDDNFVSSILISGVTLEPESNTITGNTFVIDQARTNLGYAIEEFNGGQTVKVNSYVANAIFGNYQNPAILAIGNPVILGNNGNGTEDQNTFGDGQIKNKLLIGTNNSPDQTTDGQIAIGESLLVQNNASVTTGGTLNLAINTDTFLASPGGFAGTLSVTATQSNAATVSTRTVYAAVARGTIFTFTPLATQNGSGGGAAFTLTMPSNGVVRYTDTSGAGVNIVVRMHFSGARSAA